MELKDLIITPVLLLILYLLAYIIRPLVTNAVTSKYFFPALTTKIIGAISLGLVYQFYYGGGDTFNFYIYGSNVVYQAFMDDPLIGLKLLSHSSDSSVWPYTSQMLFYEDTSSFFVIRIAAILGLLTFSTYSAVAVLFAFFCFLGMWFFFLAFYELFPHLHRYIAIAAFFIPSVSFWGSGLLKDTVVMACLGIGTYEMKKIFIDKRVTLWSVILLTLSFVVSFYVKKYVLLCFIPAALFWVYSGNLSRIQPYMLRILLLPFIIAIAIATGFYAIQKVGESDPKYALDRIAITAKETAYDIGFYSGKNAGSGYSLGEMDGTFTGMLKLGPQAINVSLFRPYLWEVRNPLMLISAVESSTLFLFTLYLIFTRFRIFINALSDPNVLFCMVFSVTFAFAVGVSTYNFGTLARYKIPLLPFYFLGLVFIMDYSNRERKLEELEETE